MEPSALPIAPPAHDELEALAVNPTRRWYEDNAATYAEWSEQHSMKRHLERFLHALPKRPAILDLGAGGGRDLAAMAELGARAIGIDNVPALAALAHRRSGCRVLVADMRDLPFSGQSFDGVWASASLLHLPRAMISLALDEAHRVLKPEGFLFSSIKIGVGEELDAVGRWFSYYGRSEWCELLQNARFSVIACAEEEALPAHAKSTRWLNVLAGRP